MDKVNSLYERGNRYFKEMDYENAFQTYQKVIELQPNHFKTHFKLAMCLEKGRGIAKSLSGAYRHYEKSANLGYAYAQFNLAVMMMNGLGCQQDKRSAKRWLQRAALQGNRRAEKLLQQFVNIDPYPSKRSSTPDSVEINNLELDSLLDDNYSERGSGKKNLEEYLSEISPHSKVSKEEPFTETQEQSPRKKYQQLVITNVKKESPRNSNSPSRSPNHLNSSPKHVSVSPVARKARSKAKNIDISILHEELIDAKKELMDTNTELKLLMAEKNRGQKTIKKKEERIQMLEKKLKKLEENSRESETDWYAREKKNKENLREVQEKLKKQLSEKDLKLSKYERQSKTESERISMVRAEYEKQMEKKEKRIQTLSQLLSEKDKEIQSLQEENDILHSKSSNHVEELMEKFSKGQSRIKELEYDLEQSEQKLKEISETYEILKIEHRKEIQDLEKKHQHELENTSVHQSQVENIRKKFMQDYEEKLNESKAEIYLTLQEKEAKFSKIKKEYVSQIQEIQEQCETIAIEKASLQKKHTEELNKLHEKISSLEEALSDDNLRKKLVDQENLILELRQSQRENQKIISEISKQNVAFIETIEMNTESELKSVEKLQLQEKKIHLQEHKIRQLEAQCQHLQEERSKIPSRKDFEALQENEKKFQEIVFQNFDKIKSQQDMIKKLKSELEKRDQQISKLNEKIREQKESLPNSTIPLPTEGPLSGLGKSLPNQSIVFAQKFDELTQKLEGSSFPLETNWKDISDRISKLRTDYNAVTQAHRNQLSEVINFCQALF